MCHALHAVWLLLAVLLGARPASAQPMPPALVPPELRPWIPWVLDTPGDERCPRLGEEALCVWPARLDLAVTERGGRFALVVFADRRQPVTLPGASPPWPQEVTLDGKPAVVLDVAGRPQVVVEPGGHRLEGRFAWTRPPEGLTVPASVGLVELGIEGTRVAAPHRTGDRLWLRSETGPSSEPERVELEVFRRIEDGVPLRVVTRLSLRASGRARELAFGKVLLEGSVPLALESELPARLEKDGGLVALVRAGQHAVTVTASFATPPERLLSGARPAPWPEREVWVWSPATRIREAELVGGVGVDASRTNLPPEWQSLRAVLVDPATPLSIKTSRRGEPVPPPNALTLNRTFWLDLDAGGYTVRDRFSGKMHQRWRLDLRAGELGHVVTGGESQLITLLGEARGVELRAGEVDLIAESRLPGPVDRIPAVGWSEPVQSLSAELRLPPGWELLGALGVDALPGTWIASWNLFALFFVLVVALAAGRLGGPMLGLLALFTLVLTHEREEAPRLLWPALLACMALLRVVPEGLFRQALRGLWIAVATALVIVGSSFCVAQLKLAFFPAAGGAEVEVAAQALSDQRDGGGDKSRLAPASRAYAIAEPPVSTSEPQRAPLAQDPAAVIQTGPGVPSWSWRSWQLSWTGPVTPDHRVRLFLLSPGAAAALGVLRLVLVVALAFGLFRRTAMGRRPPGASDGDAPAGGAAAAGALVALSVLLAPLRAGAEVPSKEVLDDLRARLTRRAECQPSCVSVSRLDLGVRGSELSVAVEAHAGDTAVLTLPGPAESWVPREVLIDGKPAAALVRGSDGFLHARLEPGRHRVTLRGPLSADELTLALGHPPAHVTVTAEGWVVDGIGEDGRPKGSLHLTRVQPAAAPGAAPEGAALPPWFQVSRELSIGVSWRSSVRVSRVSPPGTPVVLRVPLLPGERVTTEGVLVEGTEAVLSFDRDDRELRFESSLQPGPSLVLTAAAERPFTEVWTVQCGPVWHCAWEGSPPVSHQREGRLEPSFHPWPGEVVRLLLEKPLPAPGASTTVDAATLTVTPGARLSSSQLELTIRSTTGGIGAVRLPEGADVRRVQVSGRDVPIRFEDRRLSVGLAPGQNQVSIEWQEPRGLGTRYQVPDVEVEGGAVNVRVTVSLARERWLLFVSGPSWGPQVLFWLYLSLALGVAFLLLPRLPKNPLRPYQWALLAVGFTQVPVWVFVVVVGWFFAVAHREDWEGPGPWQRNLAQLGLVGWTFAFLGCLTAAVYAGLATNIEMYVEGNGSSAANLTWYVDRVTGALPAPTVVSLPRWAWRAAMLVWALWLALSFLGWLRWAWKSFTSGGAWRSLTVRPRWPAPRAGAGRPDTGAGKYPPAETAPTSDEPVTTPAEPVSSERATAPPEPVSGEPAPSVAEGEGSTPGSPETPADGGGKEREQPLRNRSE